MKAVVRLVMAQDAAVERAVCPYVDDLLVDEAVVSAEHVVEHFERFGLECKPPARAEDGARMLGLHVRRVAGELRWSRDSAVPDPPDRVTRRSVFAWCGKLVAHLPVCGWLRPAAAWVKRRANAVTRGWDDVTTDALLQSQISHVHSRLLAADPARGPVVLDRGSGNRLDRRQLDRGWSGHRDTVRWRDGGRLMAPARRCRSDPHKHGRGLI
ncbi:hypothetical protein FJT64_024796 [Amphibalanus amphitrite]|uniref:DUF7047 domain-containing protein n=1 Tax=Amphibalanus amphitrite TaxID=1232801 RepID=A0A6A4WDC2_AMPAM|nr:hypothetical protein FJT64_024796 [Amphibalanus amphitrite]